MLLTCLCLLVGKQARWTLFAHRKRRHDAAGLQPSSVWRLVSPDRYRPPRGVRACLDTVAADAAPERQQLAERGGKATGSRWREGCDDGEEL